MPNQPTGVFITGTDTDVGKTIVSAWLCAHTQTPYWKPIQTGQERDSNTVQQLAGVTIFPEAVHFPRPASPHLAAADVGKTIDLQTIQPPSHETPLVVEGAGGVMVPINAHQTMLDVMAHLKLPAIVVARTTLGTINHTCLTLAALRARNIPVLGVMLNSEPSAENAQAIAHYGETTVLATLPPLPTLTRDSLLAVPLPNALSDALAEVN